MSKVRMNGQNFEHTGDVCFRKPGSMACKADEGDGMVDGCVLHRDTHVAC